MISYDVRRNICRTSLGHGVRGVGWSGNRRTNSEESTGVIAMVDLLIADLDKEMTEVRAAISSLSSPGPIIISIIVIIDYYYSYYYLYDGSLRAFAALSGGPCSREPLEHRSQQMRGATFPNILKDVKGPLENGLLERSGNKKYIRMLIDSLSALPRGIP